MFERPVDQLLTIVPTSDMTRNRQNLSPGRRHDLVGGAFTRVEFAGRDDNVSSRLGKNLDNRSADPAGSTRDYRNFAGQVVEMFQGTHR